MSSELRELFNGGVVNVNGLADELADVFVYLSALASKFDIDLSEAVEKKFFTEAEERNRQT